MRLGVCGGGFGNAMLEIAASHPGVDGISVAEVNPERRREMAALVNATNSYPSMSDLCADSEVDAIAIFTPPWFHADHTLEALRSGKHVMCAVPAALDLEELDAVVEEVRRSGLHYMTAETSTYYASFIYCRERFRNGDFGELVVGSAENFYHPRHYDFYNRDFYANFPPMLYSTHTVAMLAGTTGQRLSRVAASGYRGLHPEMYAFRRLDAYRGNEYGAESAQFTSGAGGIYQVTEGRVVSWRGGTDVAFTLHGTEGSFEEQVGRQVWSSAEPAETADVTEMLGMYGEWPAARPPVFPRRQLASLERSELPPEGPLPDLPNPLLGLTIGRALTYLMDDFVRACNEDRRFFCDVWQASRFCAPGIVARQSTASGGEWLDIPDFGEHPDGPWRPDGDDVPADLGGSH